MAKSEERLGRLFILWGPDVDDHWKVIHTLEAGGAELPLQSYTSFHANAINNDPDPFASIFFGAAVKSLLAKRPTVLVDSAFADPDRRRRVEKVFRSVFPELVVEHVAVGEVVDPPEERTPGIVIDDDVYGDGPMSSHESVLVEADAPTDALTAALVAAAARMMTVGDDGIEHTDDAETVRANDIYTPNYVSDVSVDECGRAGFYLDCKGAIEPPMAQRLRQVLREELERHGVTSAHVRVPVE